MPNKKKKKKSTTSQLKTGVNFPVSTLLQQQSVRSADFSSPVRFFGVKLYVVDTEENFSVPECHRDLRISDLKARLELLVGIPVNFQRLQYLDEGDLPDNSTFKEHVIIPSSTITMRIWAQDAWGRLVKAAVRGGSHKLHRLGATKTSLFSTAFTEEMKPEERTEWLAHRSFVALFVAAHRGRLDVMEFLLQNGADPKYQTPLGRTALHVAVVTGQLDCLEVLLNYGAEITDKDHDGLTALVLARMWGQKESERRLFRYRWRRRMTSTCTSPKP